MVQTLTTPPPLAGSWRRHFDGDSPVAIAERAALGTSARIVVWPPAHLEAAAKAVDHVLEALDRQASRFRPDSELSWIQQSDGTTFFVSEGLADALDAALRAANWTEGLVDPTVGNALVALGYDRDFATIDQNISRVGPQKKPAVGWSAIRVEGRVLERPTGTVLDLGATAKGLGADRAAAAALRAIGPSGGVLVSLGGDVAVAGQAPSDGWPVTVVEDPGRPDHSSTQVVRLAEGALATSSVLCRAWRQGTSEFHHLIDPRTGGPVSSPWRTATVAARNCLTANAASTAVIVGGEEGASWLEATGLSARLVGVDGTVRTFGAWPEDDGGTVNTSGGQSLASPFVWRGGAR